jgi:hypothetical protein
MNTNGGKWMEDNDASYIKKEIREYSCSFVAHILFPNSTHIPTEFQ